MKKFEGNLLNFLPCEVPWGWTRFAMKLLRIFSVGRAPIGLPTERLGLPTRLDEERPGHRPNASVPSLCLSSGHVVWTWPNATPIETPWSHIWSSQKTCSDASVFSCFLHKIKHNLIRHTVSGTLDLPLKLKLERSNTRLEGHFYCKYCCSCAVWQVDY